MDERPVELASVSCRGDHGYRETTAAVRQSRFGDGQSRRATIRWAACPWKGRNVDISDEIRTGGVFTQMRPLWVPQDKLRVHRIQFCIHARSHRTSVAHSRDVIITRCHKRARGARSALTPCRVPGCQWIDAWWITLRGKQKTTREILVPCSLFLVPCNPVRQRVQVTTSRPLRDR